MSEVRQALGRQPQRADRTGAEPLTLAQLVREVYGAEQPTRPQREVVRRAVRALVEAGEAESWMGYGDSYEQHTSQAPLVINACSGDDACLPCAYGVPAAPLTPAHEDDLRRLYDKATVARARIHGVHAWRDRRAGARRRGGGRTVPRQERYVARAPTDEERERRRDAERAAEAVIAESLTLEARIAARR